MRIFYYLLSGLSLLFFFQTCEQGGSPDQGQPESTTEAAVDWSDQLSQLRGKWKRNSYPYGTIEFDDRRVKFTAGEGLVEPPEFLDFTLTEVCPNSEGGPGTSGYSFAIATETGCEGVNLDGNTFTIFYGGQGKGVTYTKMEDGESSSSAHPAVTRPGQELEPEDPATGNAAIKNIRAQYATITNQIEAGALTREATEFTCTEKDGQGRLVRYTEGQTVRMLEYVEGIGHAFVSTRMYFDEAGDLIFVFAEDGVWRFGGPLDDKGNPGTVDEITEYRWYLTSGKVIKKLKKSFKIHSWQDDPTSAEVPNTEVAPERGQHFPDAATIERLKAGNTTC